MNLLDNELVRGGNVDIRENELVKWHFKNADEILTAQQQPIKKGERYLHIACHGAIDVNGTTVSDPEIAELDFGGFHPTFLRLPDRFQKQECDHKIKKPYWEEIYLPDYCPKCKPTPEPEKCLCGKIKGHQFDSEYERNLHELVALPRQ